MIVVSRFLLCCILIAVSSGCATLNGYPEPPGDAEAEIKDLRANYYQLGAKIFGDYETAGTAQRTALRDTIVLHRIRLVDVLYLQFETAMHRESVIENIGTDAAVISINAVGALVGAAPTKSVLHAISGGIVGIKGSVDKNAFYDKTITALMTQMQANRLKVQLEIMTKLQKPDSEYPLVMAKTDVDRYFSAGTIPGAIMQIVQTAGTSASGSSQKLALLTLPSEEDSARRAALVKTLHDLAVQLSSSDTATKQSAVTKLISASKKLAETGDAPTITALPDAADAKAAKKFADEVGDIIANSVDLSGDALGKTLTALETAFAP